ncbi:putative electron transfer flavoprotein subunit alpha, mitochondrial [Schizosaccharomyces pombe]|uniref:Probable electron transfer flavoprotein subunit alpha, mitochondrial n=1 Tax=Schizosaccharomyces pombe (strain 972 / ATCC 24843) TaxID=284812 RepID=ETFA_SCHPO|nr:putative electron transfer flavoprotein alpha subunit [Schizosaccharomyces pombe]P78790.3 RecName: Full=Probable electron transfer flavoprotein subunit alpha, mitochondrial; Short=Alpha-ETF; Flags: Precursor [Schizosaccharomyces pombe 972h-]CAA15825.1 electron transfer flavoprotein alpha subunit (predicted) [Schizosaccharomyces pombe]|eukprot:NP_594612.1 putative electron transfer flavoprotein alpha subunit [Schizosaccharomyces pombe]
MLRTTSRTFSRALSSSNFKINCGRRHWFSVLTLLEHQGGNLSPASLSAVEAAKRTGGDVFGFVIGKDSSQISQKVAKSVNDLKKVIYVENPSYEHNIPDQIANVLFENVKKNEISHVFSAHSTVGKGVMPRLAAMFDVMQISDIIGVVSADTFVRPTYAGNVNVTVSTKDPIKIVTVRASAFDAAPSSGEGAATVVEGIDPKPAALQEWVSENIIKNARPDLSSAERVVAGGRPLKDKETFERILTPLADKLGAAIGATRVAVDSGYADNSLQIGQTGKIIAPKLYIAVGIDGAIQHLAGIKDSKVIAAINRDENAPIFQTADVGIVGDLFEIVPELTEKL